MKIKKYRRESKRGKERKASIEGEWLYKGKRKKMRGTVRGRGRWREWSKG